MIKIADGSIQECTQFVRATIRIGEWTDRMSFVILVLGMPFFLKHEPRILWRTRKFLLLRGKTTYTLAADVLPRASPPPPYSHNPWSCR